MPRGEALIRQGTPRPSRFLLEREGRSLGAMAEAPVYGVNPSEGVPIGDQQKARPHRLHRGTWEHVVQILFHLMNLGVAFDSGPRG